MKVKISRGACNRIKLTTKKHKKIVNVSIFKEDEVNLKPDYLDSNAIYEPPYHYIESGIIVIRVKNKHYLVDFRKEIDKEESSIVAYDSSVAIYRKRDTKMFRLDLIAYCITKEE